MRREGGSLTHEEVEVRKIKFGELWRLLRSKDGLLVQRSKSKWLKGTDANSKLFHNCIKTRNRSCIKTRNRRNEIKAIKVDEVWIQKTLEVRETVVNYFRSHVSSTWDRPKLDGVNFARL